jgi:acyl-CoA synthetase (NDP forming)
LSADSCEGVGLVLSNISEQTLEKLRNTLPEYCIIGNPLDLTGNAFSNPEMYEMALEIVLEESSVDMILVIFGDPIPNSYNLLEKQVKKAKKLRVPIAVNYLGGADVQENEIKNLQKNGVPVFPTPNRAINALSYMYRYGFNKMSDGGI